MYCFLKLISQMNKREIADAVALSRHLRCLFSAFTLLRTHALNTVLPSHISYDVKRRFHEISHHSKDNTFIRCTKKSAGDGSKSVARDLKRIRKYCTVVCVLAHTQIRQAGLEQKNAYLTDVQVNRGSAVDKVEFAHGLSEKPATRDTVSVRTDNDKRLLHALVTETCRDAR